MIQLEVGDRVEYKTRSGRKSTAVVKKIKDNLILIDCFFMNSRFTQWVDIKKSTLTRI